MTITTRRLAAISAGVAVVLMLVWYAALFRPQSHQLQSAHARYTAAEQQISQLQSQVAQLEQWEKEKPADQAKLAQLDAMVPTAPDLHSILTELNAAAISTGCQLSTLNPSNPFTATHGPGSGPGSTSSAGAQSIQITMTVAGDYPQLHGFLTALEQMPRSLLVDTINITSSSSSGPAQASKQLQANITARVFYAS